MDKHHHLDKMALKVGQPHEVARHFVEPTPEISQDSVKHGQCGQDSVKRRIAQVQDSVKLHVKKI